LGGVLSAQMGTRSMADVVAGARRRTPEPSGAAKPSSDVDPRAPSLTTLPPIAPHHDPSSTMAPRSNITGFDPKKFAAASANGTKGDPWAR
jgi:hypothetical protein